LRAVDASPTLRNKRDLIETFVDSVNTSSAVDEQWTAFIAARRAEELERLITDENLNADQARAFADAALRAGEVTSTGTALTRILPPTTRFGAGGGHAEKRATVLRKLREFVERFGGLG
ncbi:MAG TPA: type I restriction endonuclease subunit R, partial [Protaetiibacter sp.]|nr:type I restriction endonuclease subunit R [Protaetiibacter sp.]